MEFILKDKELEKFIKSLESLISKMTRFNIISPCKLYFGLDKNKLEIFPILAHFQNKDFSFKQFMYENKLVKLNKKNNENFITEEDVEKYIEQFNPFSIVHNVIFSDREIDLSLERNDLFIYSQPINIFILSKFKEFLSLNLIEYILLNYDENNNILEIKQIEVYDKENPITIRQKELYLSYKKYYNQSDLFDKKSRDYLINKKIIDLVKYSADSLYSKKLTKVLTKEDNDLEDIILNNESDKIIISKEFIKSTAKIINIWYDIEIISNEEIGNTEIKSVLAEIIYNNKVIQYIFFQYYDVYKNDIIKE